MAAKERLKTAVFLYRHKYTLEATYLAGYVVECSLKALILDAAEDPKSLVRDNRFRRHSVEDLNPLLIDRGRRIPPELLAKLRQSRWSIDLRYETGQKDIVRTQQFLETAEEVYNWVEGQLT